jgi:hypothetical protein
MLKIFKKINLKKFHFPCLFSEVLTLLASCAAICIIETAAFICRHYSKTKTKTLFFNGLTSKIFFLFAYFLGGLECVGHSGAYVSHFLFLIDVWIRTQRAAVASKRATKLSHPSPCLVTHLPYLATHLPRLPPVSHPSPYIT